MTKVSASERTRRWLASLSPEELAAHRDRKNVAQRDKRKTHAELYLWRSAKRRAIKRGLKFNLVLSDIKIPSHCPVLGIPLIRGGPRGSPNTPSLDRIKPRLGYIRGNVIVISWRANQIKSDATFAELKAIAEFYRL